MLSSPPSPDGMKQHSEPAPFYTATRYRLVSGGFGVIVACAGFYVLFGASSMGELVASAVLVAVGANCVVSGYAASEPWLSKLGPLP